MGEIYRCKNHKEVIPRNPALEGDLGEVPDPKNRIRGALEAPDLADKCIGGVLLRGRSCGRCCGYRPEHFCAESRFHTAPTFGEFAGNKFGTIFLKGRTSKKSSTRCAVGYRYKPSEGEVDAKDELDYLRPEGKQVINSRDVSFDSRLTGRDVGDYQGP